MKRIVYMAVALLISVIAVHAQSSGRTIQPRALQAQTLAAVKRKKQLAAKFTKEQNALMKKLQRQIDEFNGLTQRLPNMEPGCAINEDLEVCVPAPPPAPPEAKPEPKPEAKLEPAAPETTKPPETKAPENQETTK